ncbi:MAG TPA: alkaline phosphatase family protein, partial [Stenomitos sp.]
SAEAPKAILISLDGGGERFLERMVVSGVMPNLAALRKYGVQADYSLTNFPSKTAAGHASIWTGAYGNVNGVTANAVPLMPLGEHTLLESQSGFDSTSLKAEPIWSTVARSGKQALVLQATQLSPLSEYGPNGRLGGPEASRMTLFDSYNGLLEHDWVLDSTASLRPAVGWTALPAGHEAPQELDLKAGDTTFKGVFYDDPADPVTGYDTLEIRPRKDSRAGAVILKSGPCDAGKLDKFGFPMPVSVQGATSSVVFRLFDLAPDLSSIRLYRTAIAPELTNRPDLLPDYIGRTGGLVIKGAEELYSKGKLGPTLLQGGEGQAEDRLVETVRLAMTSRMEKLRYASKRYPWDLLVYYVPYPDGVEHMWYGLVDDRSPAYRADVGPKLWPYMEAVAGIVDEFIGEARKVAGDRAVVAVTSDHGMEGLARDFYPNVVLRRAGLLALDAKGNVDLSRTKAFYSFNDGAYVVINSTAHKGGIVPPSEVPQVTEQVVQALRAVRDPKTKARVVTGIFHANQADPKLGIGGLTGGDLYLDLQSGLYFNAEPSGDALFKERPPFTSGGHVFNPARASMHAVFYLAVPGVKKGVLLPPARSIDVAPTLCRLLDVRVPQQATGRVINEALVQP